MLAAIREGDDPVSNASSACMLTAEQEGPFYVAVDRVRSDIVLGQAGLLLNLTITDHQLHHLQAAARRRRRPLAVQRLGVYSDESSERTLGHTYLRGVRFTDNHG